MTERVLILIDGGNTYRALYKASFGTAAPLQKGDKFDYTAFATYLANKRSVTAIKYYIGIVRNTDHTSKSELMVKQQQKFLQILTNQGITIERGRIVYDNIPREKGVDVKIAIDLVIGAMRDEYDTVIVVSSDTDLLPAIKFSMSIGKKVEYVGFSNQFSTALLNESSEKRVFGKQDLTNFVTL